MPFDRVEIRDITATNDDEFWGDFYTSPFLPSIPVIGGEIIPIEATSLILAGAQSFSWMIPVILSGIGIGLFIVSRKSD